MKIIRTILFQDRAKIKDQDDQLLVVSQENKLNARIVKGFR
jgi:hypothetical protein